MLRQLCFLLLSAIPVCGSAQFKEKLSVKLEHTWLTCDENKTVYAISSGNFIKLPYPYTSKTEFELPEKEFPGFIDTDIPDKLVLYFFESHKIVLLDSLLKEKMRPFYLDELGLSDISMIFASPDDGLWFYNLPNNSLTKLNHNFMPVARDIKLSAYFQYPNAPNYVRIFENKIYFNVPSNGILVLGPGGNYITAMQLRGLMDFQIDNKAVYFYRDGILYCYNLSNLKIKKIYLPGKQKIINGWFFENEIIVETEAGIAVWGHDINPLQD